MNVLDQSHELRIRWASPHAYDAAPPFVSRVSPGLHVFWSGTANGQDGCVWDIVEAIGENAKADAAGNRELLCPMLGKLFHEALKCDTLHVSTHA